MCHAGILGVVVLINLEILLPQLLDVRSLLSCFLLGLQLNAISYVFMILTADALVSFGLIFSPSVSVLKHTYDFVMFPF